MGKSKPIFWAEDMDLVREKIGKKNNLAGRSQK
jgi:hypothetical protein